MMMSNASTILFHIILFGIHCCTNTELNLRFYVIFDFSDASFHVFFFQAEDGIRDLTVTGVQTCALPICPTGSWQGTSGDSPLLRRGLSPAVPCQEPVGLLRPRRHRRGVPGGGDRVGAVKAGEIGRASCRERGEDEEVRRWGGTRLGDAHG